MRVPRGPKVAYTRRKWSHKDWSPVTHEIRADIVAECVPLWRACWERATRSKKADSQKGRSVPMRSPDSVLASRGITFAKDRKLWASYERAIRRAAQGGAV